MNRLVLAAQLVERSAMRYTPAGLPALDLLLKSESEVSQNGQPRKVRVEIRAVVIGDITRVAGALMLGSPALMAGFLAHTRNGKGLVFHVTDIAAEPAAPVTV
jgi:primosomal replication protein N